MNRFSHLTLIYIFLLGFINSACTNDSSDVSDASPKNFDMVFEGDSDIELWNTTAYPNAINLGVGGATCEDVDSEVDQMLARYQPTKVVLVCGENDLFERNATETFGSFQAIVTAIHAAGAQVVYMGTKPEPVTTDLHGQYREYDALIEQYAIQLGVEQKPPLVMIDVYNGFLELGNPSRLYAADQLHLSNDGYALWDEWLQQSLTDNDCIIWRSGSCVHAFDAESQ